MNPIKSTGRILGILFLFQFLISILINLFLLGPALFDSDFLANIADSSSKIVTSTLFSFVSSAISIVGALLLLSIVTSFNKNIALAYLAFSIIGFTATLVDNTLILSMLSISKEYSISDAGNIEYFKFLGAILQETRGWTHIMDMLLGCFPLLAFFYLMYTSKYIPKALSIWGILGAILMLINVVLSFYEKGQMILYSPIGLAQIFLSIWLIIKGFKPSNSPTTSSKQQEKLIK
ncbi:DUF4386 domain-containing protein [Aquimarina sp. 2201CG5-10]|uniref:DUF4386 domain-containing protein n=1 Tax=Aquimarina callyspongiae TaxID=3098150 RepID=UPI002AB3ABA9|nr:DUF4386 domain-containing protein [Aquimarina sp. 2201CG5-10]MDY8135638.1 DUF4386 domain-containing protein [Aquimarina sp. 2201CG5-10]